MPFTKEQKKIWRQTPKGKKQMMLDAWRKKMVKGDLHKIYDKYINTNNCYICNYNFNDKNISKISLKNMDHNHTTGYYRFTICRSCNVRLGSVDFNFRNCMNELKFIFNLPKVFQL